eukprot:350283-Chlamydomonas_euryale.AAC.2
MACASQHHRFIIIVHHHRTLSGRSWRQSAVPVQLDDATRLTRDSSGGWVTVLTCIACALQRQLDPETGRTPMLSS